MRGPHFRKGEAATGAAPIPNAAPGLSSADFLLSMVEEHWHRRNGKNRMEPDTKAEVELAQIEKQLENLQNLAGESGETRQQIQQLHDRIEALRREVHSGLTAWEKTELARHPQRPYTLDYVERLFTDWSEIHGDRRFGEDPAIVCGMARLNGDEVMVIGHQKARDTKQKVYRKFGMPHPEGYRKALWVMQSAEKFQRSILTFVDTD